MLPLRVVLDRNRGGSFLVFLFVGAALYAMFLFLTYYFQVNLGYTPLEAASPSCRSASASSSPPVSCPSCSPSGSQGTHPAWLVWRIVGDVAVDPDRPGLRRTGCWCSPRWSSCRWAWPGSSSRGQHLPHRSRKPRRGRRLGDAQHLSTDRRLARHRAAEHRVRRRGHGLLHHQPTDQSRPGRADPPLAFIHGYHVAFFWGAALFACALITSIVLINAHKEDIPAEPAALGEPVD